MTTSSGTRHTTFTAFLVGARSLWQHPGLAVAFLVATLTQGTLQGGMVWALRQVLIILNGPGGMNRRVLLVGALAVCAIWFVRAAGIYAAQVLAGRLASRVELRWMREVLEKLLTLPVSFFDKSSRGDLVMTAYNDTKTVRLVTVQFGQLVLYLSQLAGLMVAAWAMSAKLTLIGLFFAPLGCVPVYWLGRRLTEAARREQKQGVSLQDSYLQLTSGIRVIKVNAGESQILERARQVSQQLWRSVLRQIHAGGLARLLLDGVEGFGLILILVIGGADVAAGRMPWQSLLGLLLAVMAIYAPVLGLLSIYSYIRQAIPDLDRLDRILNTVPEIQDRPGARPLHEGPATIELRNVSFTYNGQPALSDISAVIHRGETIGIVGPTGAGKSTLLSLLLRFYDPTDGAILFDGVDLRDLRHRDLMSQSSIVLQEPFLFIDTIANNIRMGRPGATLDEVVAAAKAAGVHDEILQMEFGYETVVGTGPEARGLSGGQKQRICVAAALLKNAPLLFLDEATNSLDSVSEAKVQAAIERLMRHRTTFVIAHRFSTLRNADRIIVLEQGRMVGFDSRTRLLTSCKTFRKLWASQMALVSDSPEVLPRRPEMMDV
ncbi:MAG: ABC transporter ATP-binding protein [Bacillati bacterium ANGP1]|uniref:ABC transporter ATP-binding protein n=1 Tax=Candidatus Segetimicrobium genomatis TaxID=2569760 RepID=A0A537LFL5_9BACT|nr:MAG: ABC transporter ATP-binding protein [Terrabacteria group bacterium ANGP1]